MMMRLREVTVRVPEPRGADARGLPGRVGSDQAGSGPCSV